MPRFERPSREATAHLQRIVAALRCPPRYHERPCRVEVIETHLAWVFLTDAHAYKLRKPVRTRLIDYSTVEARREACETELRLNRRLAAPVYRAVVPITKTGSAIRVEGGGRAIEWMVKMDRLPRDRMLDTCIAEETVPRAPIRHLGAKLSAFYERAIPLGWSADTYVGRIAANVKSKGNALTNARYGLDADEVRSVVAQLLRWIDEHRPLLGPRGAHVLDAHGDLRPEHVCLTAPPMVIDCLDFNRSLRLLDPLSDLAFLSLETSRLGAGWVGERLIGHYRTRTGDDAPGPLVRFYESYHALIRATIAIWHLDDEGVRHPERWRGQARTYLRLARERMAPYPSAHSASDRSVCRR